MNVKAGPVMFTELVNTKKTASHLLRRKKQWEQGFSREPEKQARNLGMDILTLRSVLNIQVTMSRIQI